MKSSARLGPGASTILMILVVLVMTMLGVLALFSARGDMQMSTRTEAAASDYYDAQTEFSLFTQKTDKALLALREQAAGDAEEYDRLVREQFGVGVGEQIDYSALVGDTRLLRAGIRILPLSEQERFAVEDRHLEPNQDPAIEEADTWNLIG